MNDDLERRVRESLTRHAAEAASSLKGEPGYRTDPPGRKGWRAPLAAAAAVLLVVGGVGLGLRSDDPPPAASPDPNLMDGELPTRDPERAPTAWRVELWHGAQISVPPDWGWGGAPYRDGSVNRGGSIDCGAEAFRAPGGRFTNGDPTVPYVGRPLMMTDSCAAFDPDDPPEPTAPYVWFGAAVPLGSVDLGGGWVMQTVEVADTTVSVATRDAELRQRIVDTAGPADAALCDPQPTSFAGNDVDVVTPESLVVCAYGSTGFVASESVLIYAVELPATSAAQFDAALTAAPSGPFCADTYSTQRVLLRTSGTTADGSAGVQVNVAYTDDCTFISRGGDAVRLSAATVSPWAVGGLPAYLVGPSRPPSDLAPYFRGLLG